jgi:hypothetical protein
MEVKEKAETIKGYVCNELKVTFSEKGQEYQNSYFYTPKMAINPLWLSKNKLDNNAAVYNKMGAVPLKIITNKDGVKITYMVHRIETISLDLHFKELERLTNVLTLTEQTD